ncbi:2Fe-2S iron-sulfur cluster binding domain-containing protein [Xylophilus sp. Kf1]|nr:2Fe-2S iron-sulfur cluster binding domain-containing protein [Xylophilus sp. Kf1]
MTPIPPSPPLRLRWPTQRNLRWTSGLLLLAYVTLHLIDHALGLVSLAAAEAMLRRVHDFWHSLPGTVLLYGAAALHVMLAFASAWERRSLRLPPTEALRILLGFSLPLLLAMHLALMRWAYERYGVDPNYARVVRGLWSPSAAAFQITMMAAAWAHGCLGLHLALRARAVWRRWLPGFVCLVVLLPVLAALGFVSMGREIGWTGTGTPASLSAEQARATENAARVFMLAYAALLGLLMAGRVLRAHRQRLAGGPTVTLRYPGRSLRVPLGWSVLEASRSRRIAHLSVCGGRARCSTCRVRVAGAPSALPAPGPDEIRTLQRVRAPADVRLACQLRPQGDITVEPLFVPGPREASGRTGRESEVAILFVDLRRWSGLSERQWPFDLVYTLDRYFEIVGGAAQECGGLANQFIGDSVMAIFGLHGDLPTACRQALAAARLIDRRLDQWSDGFEREFGQRIDFGMGLHAGRAVVAEIGWQEHTTFSAVGEVVNTASRLQDHSKTRASRLVVSLFVAQQAGLSRPDAQVEEVSVRGREQPLTVLHLARP